MPDRESPYRYQLRETTIEGICQGLCPVCLELWALDPEFHCSCTRPRPGDAAAEAEARAISGRMRSVAIGHRLAQVTEQAATRDWYRRRAAIRARP
jgi:hypothetical protein